MRGFLSRAAGAVRNFFGGRRAANSSGSRSSGS
ncbi:hypothetical protein P1062_0212320 [Pasteurella multocida subsp. multocida P1062]|nr:hypothetical protein P1062_0212320 [Pasteurella multocida subsp. multocida P1062]